VQAEVSLSYARTYSIGRLGLAFDRGIAIAGRDPVPYQGTTVSLADERLNGNTPIAARSFRALWPVASLSGKLGTEALIGHGQLFCSWAC